MDTEQTTQASRHPFARAGYAAPYRFVAPHEAVYQPCPGAPVQAAGTCDVCGTCYRYGATFRDANGVQFRTGCDCAAKSLRDFDSALAAKADRAGKDFRNAAARERRAAKRRDAAAKREAEHRAAGRGLARARPRPIHQRLKLGHGRRAIGGPAERGA